MDFLIEKLKLVMSVLFKITVTSKCLLCDWRQSLPWTTPS